MGYCRYSIAWQGACKTECEGDICEKHTKVVCCVCGHQATNECNHTGQFVCGAPLCNNCEGHTDASKPSGGWGFQNHSHRQRAQAQEGKQQ